MNTGTPKSHPEAIEVELDEKGLPIVGVNEEKATNNPQLNLAAKPLVTERNPYTSMIALGVIALSLIWRVARLIKKPRP